MKKYTQLTREEKYQIYALKTAGQSNAQISKVMGRHKSTIGREMTRNPDTVSGHLEIQIAKEQTVSPGQITESQYTVKELHSHFVRVNKLVKLFLEFFWLGFWLPHVR